MASSYIEQALYTYLTTDTATTSPGGAVGGRIFFAHADPDTARPYIVFRTVSDPHEAFAFGQANSGQPRVQFSVFDDDRFNVLSIAQKLREKLRFYSAGTMDSMTVHAIQVGGTVLLREPNEDVYQGIVDVLPIYIDAS